MRVVGGRFRGRPLAGPRTNAIRPTSDRLRESLFNILAHSYALPQADTRVLDLFAGTGALGIDALSRGAAQALFVENGVEGRGIIRTNMEAFGLNGVAKILRRELRAWKRRHDRTVRPCLLDPPYGRTWEKALAGARRGWVGSNAWPPRFLEEDSTAAVDRRRDRASSLLEKNPAHH